MKILGIDSSGNVGSVAYVSDGVVISEYTLNNKKTHSQTLLPMIDDMVKKAEINLDELDAIAISQGPGSFTGLRIGSATAKGIAYVKDIPIVPVYTTEALCYNLYGETGLICPIMDARRGQVYTGIFNFSEDGSLETLLETTALSIEELLEKLAEFNQQVTFLGDGVDVFKDKIKELLKIPYKFAFGNNRLQRASSVALYGEILFEKGIKQDAASHAPIYLRMSQAERERLEKEGKA